MDESAVLGNLIPWCKKAVCYALAGGTVIALLPVFTDAPWFHHWVPFWQDHPVARQAVATWPDQGSAPFSSMIVEWNPQTVKRRQGEPLDVVLDTGVCIGGIYKPA